jgi:hypothetical protein
MSGRRRRCSLPDADSQEDNVKQEATPALIAAAVAVAVLLLGFFVWKYSHASGGSPDRTTIDARIAAKKARGD